jgi:plasmid stabilization system protein ParE
MALPRVIRSAHARQDLDDIWRYLDREAGARVADRVLTGIVDAMHRTAGQPVIHHERREYPGGPRRVNAFGYAIFFEPLPEGGGIFVWRVIHSARDLPRIVRRPEPPGEGDSV